MATSRIRGSTQILPSTVTSTELADSSIVAGKIDPSAYQRDSGPVVNPGASGTFSLTQSPVTASEIIVLNGEIQRPGDGNDYNISGQTVTFLRTTFSGDTVYAWYLRGGAASPSAPSNSGFADIFMFLGG